MSEIKKKRPVELAKAPSGSSITAINEVDPHTQKILKIRELMKLRDSARTHGEFGKSDSIRDHLVEKYHIDIIDQKDGPSGWKFKDGSSNKINANTRVPKAEDGRIQVVNNSRKKRDRDEEIASSLHTKKQKSDPQLVGIATSSKKVKTTSAEQERNKALAANISSTVAEGGRRMQGVLIEDLKAGAGKVCKIGDRIKMHYVGKLKTNGKVFDSSVNKPFVFRLGRGEVIAGWDIGCQGMAVGGRRRLTIPPEKAYGRAGAPPTIPGNATLVFEVSLVDIA